MGLYRKNYAFSGLMIKYENVVQIMNFPTVHMRGVKGGGAILLTPEVEEFD